jgi:tetratricopeptide (TPR) repeat protein
MAGVHNEIAQALLTLGRYSEVVEEAQEELKIRPRSYLAHYLCGQGYLKQKEYAKAKECYETALEIEPDSVNAHYGMFTACSRLGLKDDAARSMARFKELKEADSAKRTEEFHEYGDLVEAKKKLAEICGDAEKLYRKKADSKMSRLLLERAVGLDAENGEYLRGLAFVYQMAQQLPMALQMYEKATLAEPDNSMNYMNIGNISVQLRQYENAERAFRKVTEVAPGISIGYRELARLYLKTKTKIPEALKLARKAVQLEPTAANYMVLSWACDKSGDIAGAHSNLKRATELEPGNPEYRRKYELMLERDANVDF